MASRTFQIEIIGDPSSFTRATRKVSADAKRMGDDVEKSGGKIRGFATVTSKGLGRVGVAAGGMAAAGAGAAALLSKSFVNGATSINESLTKNEQIFGRFAGRIDEFSKRSAASFGISRQAALEATGTFGNLFTAMEVAPRKASGMSVALTKLAADLASFNNASPEETLEALRSGLIGEAEPLRRFGILLSETRVKQEAYRQGLGEHAASLTEAQKGQLRYSLILRDSAKAQGDFARTSGGLANQQRILKARFADAGAELGGKLMPYALSAVKALNSLFNESSSGGRVIRALGNATRTAADWINGAFQDAIAWGRRFANRNREDIQAVAGAFRNLAKVGRWLFEEILIPVIKRVLPVLKGWAEGVIQIIRGVVRVVTGIVNGDWKQLWQGFKDIPAGTVKAIKASLGGLWRALRDAIKALAPRTLELAKGVGSALGRGILDGVKSVLGVGSKSGGLFDTITNAIPGAQGLKSIGKAIGDGVGKRIGVSMGAPGLGGGALQGADPDLAPFASIGARFGLTVSSGIRPGSITSSGNRSYHATGDAIDMSGSAGGMMSTFRFLRKNFGSRLRELIYTPGGVGIKDGRPYTYTGAVAQDHYDHVHVAYTGPFGDGLGRFDSTAYGPPWNAMNGTGTTATGVDLRPAKKAYGVAVDPSVIPLGTKLKITPNPFGYGGLFTAFDTGGAIKGKRIDFYDWRGRKAQMAWGRRSVTVSTGSSGGAPGASGGGGGAAGNARDAFLGAQRDARGQAREAIGAARGAFREEREAGRELPAARRAVRRAKAEARDDLSGLIKVMVEERTAKRRRLKAIRKVLRRRINKKRRLRLLTEEAELIAEIGDLNDSIKEYKADQAGGATTISRADELDAGVDPGAQDGETTPGGGADTGTGTGAAEPDPNIAILAGLVQEQVANQRRIITLMQTQQHAIPAALAAMVDGSIGGTVGLGFQSVGYAGNVAGY